jgi:hypothetical protein
MDIAMLPLNPFWWGIGPSQGLLQHTGRAAQECVSNSMLLVVIIIIIIIWLYSPIRALASPLGVS